MRVENLRFAQLKTLSSAAAQWVLKKTLAALGAQVEAFLTIRFVAHQCTVFIELVETFEHFVKISEVIAIFVDPGFIGSWCRVQLHL
jgi:hypothetical protein